MTSWGEPRSEQGSAPSPEYGSRPGTGPRRGLEQGPLLTSMWSWLLGSSKKNRLNGKRALVSSSGGGLGRQLSLELVRQGCKVICVDQDAEQVQETLGMVQFQQLSDGAGQHAAPSVEDVARGYACDWRDPGEALGLSRAVTSTEGGVDLIFVVPESNNNDDSAVNIAGKVIGNEFWPLLGFLPGMLARSRGHVVHVLDEHIALKTGVVADAWIESLQEVGANVTYTKVHLHADQARHRPCRAEDAARRILSAVCQGSAEVHIAYPVC